MATWLSGSSNDPGAARRPHPFARRTANGQYVHLRHCARFATLTHVFGVRRALNNKGEAELTAVATVCGIQVSA